MKQIILILLLIWAGKALSHDTSSNQIIENKIKLIENQIDLLKSNQINYKIEKDLIKNTYSNNYNTISLILTGVVALFGFLTFTGFRDVNTLKREYQEELQELNKLRLDIQNKSEEFKGAKKELDEEIKSILEENEAQNNKIKILEIKEKIESLHREKRYSTALQFCLVALELDEKDIMILRYISNCHSKLKNYQESIKFYKKILELSPDDESAIVNLIEVYIYSKNLNLAKNLIENKNNVVSSRDNGELLQFFKLMISYQEHNQIELDKLIKYWIEPDNTTAKKRIPNWDLKDALIFVNSSVSNPYQRKMLHFLWYLNGEINYQSLVNHGYLAD